VDAAAEVLAGRGLDGAPVAPQLPETALAVAEQAMARRPSAAIHSTEHRI
jgi:hypothetical protein